VPVDKLAEYYGNGSDELHLAFNFPFITSAFDAGAMRKVVEDAEALIPEGAWPAWTGSNHDMARFSSRWAGGDPRKARLALLVLLCLKGTPVLYQGDEIGLCDSEVAQEDLRDPLGVLYWPAYAGRDAMRTPMPWSDVAGGGFTEPTSRPWLPLSDTAQCNVEDQRSDPGSMLTLARDLISIRKRTEDLRTGGYVSLASPEGVWAWRRGDSVSVVLNMTDTATELVGFEGRIVIGTRRERDGETVDGVLRLGEWEGVLLDSGPA
jgi:alpha-glucosidase